MSPDPRFRALSAHHIVVTARALGQRIAERFPESGLSQVAREVEQVALEAADVAAWLSRPHYLLRTSGFVLSAGLCSIVLLAVFALRVDGQVRSFSYWVQSIESLINDLVFVGIAVYFLLGLETRRKRAKVVAALHVLRSLAHIIDMHQLTKDPDRAAMASRSDTVSSPKRDLSAFELTRYLDYCSELLAIVSKVAALYVQELSDSATVAAASAVEELCVGLSRTIWQKIVILDRVLEHN
ncbi:MAG TPA: hypothetical protein VJV78_46240 [Polyangiales bacterium]|nr:hypothetical protein [Polyangiales bacterium]